jgi:hypothetical protein
VVVLHHLARSSQRSPILAMEGLFTGILNQYIYSESRKYRFLRGPKHFTNSRRPPPLQALQSVTVPSFFPDLKATTAMSIISGIRDHPGKTTYFALLLLVLIFELLFIIETCSDVVVYELRDPITHEIPKDKSRVIIALQVTLCAIFAMLLAAYVFVPPNTNLSKLPKGRFSSILSFKYSSNAFLDLFANVLFPLQSLWQARWYPFLFQLFRELISLQNGPCTTQIFTFGRRYNHYRD